MLTTELFDKIECLSVYEKFLYFWDVLLPPEYVLEIYGLFATLPVRPLDVSPLDDSPPGQFECWNFRS